MVRRSTLTVVFAFVIAACCSGLLVTAQQVQDVGTWRPSGPIADSRSGAGIAALSDGRTLITGGRLDADGTVTDSIVVYDPVTNEREEVGHLRAPRVGHTATLLKDGRVLIIGGSVANVPTTEIEMVDLSIAPDATGSTFAFLNQARTRHAATRLPDGRVLIVGGNVAVSGSTPPAYSATDSAEMYDPESGQVTILPERLNVPRAGLSATTTIDGRVLIAGGTNDTGDLRSAEIFDPARGFELLETELSVARSGHTAILLPHNNTVLIAGGTSDNEPVSTTDAFLPAQFPDPYSYGVGAFAAAESMPVARTRAMGGPSGDSGFAYVAGGGTADSAIYRYPTVKADKNDYAPGEPALITGSGWQPNSEVTLTFQEDPAVHDDYVLKVPTDALGNFSWDRWAPEEHDLAVRFYLLVTDAAQSRAQITFTDNKNLTINFSGSGGGSVSFSALSHSSGVGACTSNCFRALNNDETGVLTATPNTGSVFVGWTIDPTSLAGTTCSGSTNPCSFSLNNKDLALTATFAAPLATTLALQAPSPASMGFTSTGPVTLSATLTRTSGGAAVAGATVAFSVDGSLVGSATTNASGVATLSGYNPSLLTAGGHTIQASFAATTISGTAYSASTSGTQTLTVNAAATTTVASNATATFSTSSQSVSLAASVTSAAGTVNQGTVTFTVKDGVNTIGSPATSATLAGGAATATFSLPAATTAKSYTIQAVYNPAATGANFATSTDTAHTLTVGKANQTITFGALASKTFGDADFTVSASASSSLAVSFTAAGNCTVTGALVHITGAGSCTITTSQAGDSNYNGATAVPQTFAIGKAASTTAVTVTNATYDANPHGATAAVTGVGGLNESVAVSYVGRNGTTYLSSSTAPTDAGDYTASASFAGDANHLGSTDSKDYSIAKANQTITFAPLASRTYGDADFTVAATATSSLTVGLAASGTCTITGASVHITGAGSCTITASQGGSSNYNAATDVAQPFSIGKATATITVTPYDVTFDGNAHTATGTASGVGGVDLSTLLTLLATTHTNAGSYPGDAWTFAGDGNYAASSGTVDNKISKANATIVVDGYNGVYNSAAHGATGSAKGIGGVDLAGLNLGDTFTNVPGGTAHWVFTDVTGNYNDKAGDVAIVISKADATVNVIGYTGVFDGAAHGATGSAKGIGGISLSGLALGASFSNVPGGTAHWVFTDATGNYNDDAGDVTIAISKADATIHVTGYTGVFDGAARGATGSATGVGGVSLSGLALGASFTNVPGGTAHWVFTDVTGNYNDAAGDVAIVISKADATISVTGYTGVFDGAAHGATGTAKGVGGVSLSGLALGASFTNVPGGTAYWVFIDATGNYNDAAGDVTIVISKADATITVTGHTGVFDGSAHGATGTAKGIGGASLAGLNLGATFTNVPGGTAQWVFTDATGNYNDDAGDVTIAISKADATIHVTGYTGVFDGAAHGATGSATGVGGVSLSGLALGASFTNVPGGTAHWVFTDTTGNYNDAAGEAAIVISKADATVSVTGYTGVFDGAAHGATGSATGVGGVSLSGLALGASFSNVPGGTAHWVFTDATGNYNDDAGDVTIAISKADATIHVTGYTGVFDGAARGATGSATGVGGVSLSGLALGASFTNVPGGTAHWVFTDVTGNYNDAAGDVAIVISKADATISVTGYTGVFDGAAHGATGTAKGIGGVSLNGLALGASFSNVPGGTAHWVFTDATGNYNDDAGDVAIVISKADATVDVIGYTGVFDSAAHGATGSAKGIGGISLSGLALGASFSNVPGGTAHWVFTDATGNYNDAAGDVAIVITKADAAISVTGYTGVFDGAAHGATGTAKGVGGVSLSGLALGASFSNVPGGTAHWVFSDTTGNYNDAAGDVAIVITKADATVNVTGYTGVFDGAAHGATGSAKGVGGVTLAGLNLGASFTNVPGGTAHWVFTDATGNYNDDAGDVAIVIRKADATISVTGYTGVFDGASHGATGTAKGVGAVTLAGLNLGASFTNVPGGTAHWVFADATGNYNDDAGDVAIVLHKADATISVTGYTGVFDGAAHGAAGTAKGIGGTSLAGLDLGASFTNVPGGTAHWVFTDGTGNYNNAEGNAAIVITKADPTISVSGYTGVYDAAAHGATGSATGVGGVSVAGLNLGASFTNVPGGTAHWVFTDVTGNYNDAAGDVAIVISKAEATISVTGYTGVFDGAAHGAAGTAKGIGGTSLAGLDLGASFTNVPGGTAHWVFIDGTGNYNNAEGNAAIVITKADPAISVSGYTGVYDAAAHGATGSATGVGGVSVAGLNLGSSFTNVPGGTAHWVFTDATGNYNDKAGDVAINITKAEPTIVVDGYTGVYDGAGHGATGSATGVNSVNLAGLNLGASFTNVPGGTAHWVFTDVTGNYNNKAGDVAISITKATLTVKADTKTKVYDGVPFTAFTATMTGFINNETQQVVTGAPAFSTAPVSPAVKPGTYTIKPAQGTLAAANYTFAVENATLNINYGTCSAANGAGNVVLPPINSDGSSVYNRKGGSTIPVKFRVCDAAGKPISDSSLVFGPSTSTLTMVSAVRGTVSGANEDGIIDIPDAAFRWTGQEWIFNMATSNLTSGTTYKFQINVMAGAPITFQIGIK